VEDKGFSLATTYNEKTSSTFDIHRERRASTRSSSSFVQTPPESFASMVKTADSSTKRCFTPLSLMSIGVGYIEIGIAVTMARKSKLNSDVPVNYLPPYPLSLPVHKNSSLLSPPDDSLVPNTFPTLFHAQNSIPVCFRHKRPR
jgi:hypothetical protein